MENAFTECFSLLELHWDSILDILSVVKAKQQCELGCSDHCKAVAAEVRFTSRPAFTSTSKASTEAMQKDGNLQSMLN